MPDAYGNFKGIAVNGAAWDRIFGQSAPPRQGCDLDAPPCSWGYDFGCPITGCRANRDKPTSDR